MQPAAGVDHRQRVEPLLAVADRQRHVDRGQADGGHLGHRHRAGPADGQVGGGVGQVHPVQVRHRDVGRVAVGRFAKVERVLRAVRVQHRNTRRGKVFGGRGDGTVDRLRALRPAEHQQHPRVVGEPEMCPGLGAQRHPVQRGDRRAHRHADDLGLAAQPRIRDGRQHPPRRAGADPVGPARAGVGFVDHHGDAAPARGQVRGQRDVAAEADDDVGADVVEHGAGLPDRPAHPHRQPQQVTGRLAGQRHRRDQFEVIAAFGHQPGFQPALRCPAR